MSLQRFLEEYYGCSLPMVGLEGEVQLYLSNNIFKGDSADKEVGGAIVCKDFLQGIIFYFLIP